MPDIARLVLEDGTEIDQWDSYSINSSFLTPTDGWSFTFGGEQKWSRVRHLLQPDYRIRILIDDKPQLTGWIDSVEVIAEPSSGVRVTVQGRDVLRPLCKANIHPDVRIKGRTVAELIEAVLQMYYTPGNVPDVYLDNEANRALVGAVKGGKKTRDGVKAQVEYCQAHPSEGAFEFLARNLRRFGLWMWAAADGGLVVAGPNYTQQPSYVIQRVRGDKTPRVLTAHVRWDRSNTPSSIRVKGKSAAKEFDKATVVESLVDREARQEHFVEPLYIVHDQAESKAECLAFARQEMTEHKREELVYTCTCVGHSDRATGNVYAVDTIATVNDEMLGVSGPWYVSERTFRKDLSGGTRTDLTLVPLHSIQFSDVDAPAAASETASKGDKLKGKRHRGALPIQWDAMIPGGMSFGSTVAATVVMSNAKRFFR